MTVFLVPEIRLDGPVHLDGQRIAVAVLGIAGGDAHPALADAIFLDIGLLDALEADADVAREHRLVVIRAARIDAEPVRQLLGGFVRCRSQQRLDLFPQCLRRRGRRMPRHHLAVTVDQEFGEIPFDRRAEQARLRLLQMVEQRMDVKAVDLDLLEHREGHVVFAFAERRRSGSRRPAPARRTGCRESRARQSRAARARDAALRGLHIAG